MSDVTKRLHDWLLIAGQVVRPKPGHAFEVKEVPKPKG